MKFLIGKMGFGCEIRLVAKERDATIEIYPADSKENNGTHLFTIEHLIGDPLGKNCDTSIDISRISSVELSRCDLTDLPEYFKKLNLKYLGLSRNKLSKVPVCLYSGLNYLESLDLSNNQIQNFDMEPACLPYLKKVILDFNKFDVAPKWFLTFRCTNMEEFSYSHNKAKHYNFMKNSFNMNLLKLKKLVLVNSCLIDPDFKLLKCFRQLQHLDISNQRISLNTPSTHCNRFEDLDDLFVKPKWKELNVLKLNNLSISIFPEGVAWIESLQELYIFDNCISWLPDDIQYLVNLKILNVSTNELISLPKVMPSMQNLTALQVSNNSIDFAPDFSSMSNLKTLDLYNNCLSSVSFNVDTVSFVDVEGNYCDTMELENYSLYEQKKKALRREYSSMEERSDGPKEQRENLDEYDEYYEKNKCMSDFYEFYEQSGKASSDCGEQSVAFDENENWDLPPKIRKSHSDIDSDDDKWQGEEDKPGKRHSSRTKEKVKVYVSDDDWMFIDCDESCYGC
ncbi:hypothetical protein NQ315_015616 [Exocentrus adspersus]|uniref:Uncharacterized protein n=1 Tax=Exocentrus adspersus TaxID=1586481 RepID=A0AAV8W3X7_9CUCU|nr:hypothetical protein NQ315_015616 [Exocentrus adspersus]